MADLSGLSDEALAVFAFAAYHELSSGQRVRGVVRRDGAGHQASDKAVAELDERGLITAEYEEILFTPDGEEALQGSETQVSARRRVGSFFGSIPVWCGRAERLEEERVEEAVKKIDATDGYRAEGVPVVRLGEREEAALLGPSTMTPVLERHLQRHLDRG